MSESGPSAPGPLLLELPDSTPIERRGVFADQLRVPQAGRLLGRLGLFDRAAADGEILHALDPALSLPSVVWACSCAALAPTTATREEAAARAVFAALRVREQMTDPDWFDAGSGEPVEKDTYGRFFATALVPFSGTSFVLRTSQTMHLAVLVKGRAFRIDLERRGEPIDLGQLFAAFETCALRAADGSVTAAPCAAIAATTGTCAATYERLAATRVNLVSLRALDTALMVICLDETRPETPYETGRLAQASAMHNRWFNAALQLVVFANGNLAFVGSPLVGLEGTQSVTFVDMFGEAHAALAGERVTPRPWNGVTPLAWSYPVEMLEGPSRMLARAHAVDRGRLFSIELGAAQARQLGVPATAALHLALQAATYQLLGPRGRFRQRQLVSMRHASRGGLELYDTVSAASLEFCAALHDGSDDAMVRQALRRAADDYRSTVFAVKTGMILRYPRGDTAVTRAAHRLVDRLTAPKQTSRWSVLAQPKTFALLGRFGVEPAQHETWAHAFIDEQRIRILATEPPGAAVPLAELQPALEKVVARITSLLPAAPPLH